MDDYFAKENLEKDFNNLFGLIKEEEVNKKNSLQQQYKRSKKEKNVELQQKLCSKIKSSQRINKFFRDFHISNWHSAQDLQSKLTIKAFEKINEKSLWARKSKSTKISCLPLKIQKELSFHCILFTNGSKSQPLKTLKSTKLFKDFNDEEEDEEEEEEQNKIKPRSNQLANYLNLEKLYQRDLSTTDSFDFHYKSSKLLTTKKVLSLNKITENFFFKTKSSCALHKIDLFDLYMQIPKTKVLVAPFNNINNLDVNTCFKDNFLLFMSKQEDDNININDIVDNSISSDDKMDNYEEDDFSIIQKKRKISLRLNKSKSDSNFSMSQEDQLKVIPNDETSSILNNNIWHEYSNYSSKDDLIKISSDPSMENKLLVDQENTENSKTEKNIFKSQWGSNVFLNSNKKIINKQIENKESSVLSIINRSNANSINFENKKDNINSNKIKQFQFSYKESNNKYIEKKLESKNKTNNNEYYVNNVNNNDQILCNSCLINNNNFVNCKSNNINFENNANNLKIPYKLEFSEERGCQINYSNNTNNNFGLNQKSIWHSKIKNEKDEVKRQKDNIKMNNNIFISNNNDNKILNNYDNKNNTNNVWMEKDNEKAIKNYINYADEKIIKKQEIIRKLKKISEALNNYDLSAFIKIIRYNVYELSSSFKGANMLIKGCKVFQTPIIKLSFKDVKY